MSSHNLPRGLTDQGLTYHVTSEVNRHAFELEPVEMKELFLTVIAESKTKKGFKFKLWNFCIMGNHFHFLITPEKGQSLSEILKLRLLRATQPVGLLIRLQDCLIPISAVITPSPIS
ncbi:MAG: transposase [Spirochaetaceae bacterium]|nr:transposase [Spirochaetaceae bacterium]